MPTFFGSTKSDYLPFDSSYCCRCARVKWSRAGARTTNAMARRRCLPRGIEDHRVIGQLHRRHTARIISPVPRFIEAPSAPPDSMSILVWTINYATEPSPQNCHQPKWFAQTSTLSMSTSLHLRILRYQAWWSRWLRRLANKRILTGLVPHVKDRSALAKSSTSAMKIPRPSFGRKTADQILPHRLGMRSERRR